MGVGKWTFKEKYSFKLVNKIKICGIEYNSNPFFFCEDQWKNIIIKASNIVNMYKHTGSTIFGRAILINNLVIPKIVYLANIIEPPTKYIFQLNNIIRSFIFKNTLKNIKHTTIIQNKEDGGINLQDIKTKICALRLKFIGQVVKNPNDFPLTIYYYGLRLSNLIPIQNNTPHYFGTNLHPFYRSISRTLSGNEPLIHNKYKEIYTTLKKQLQENLAIRIKWGKDLNITDFKDTFTNLHNKHIATKAKEISYRLIFGMTPFSKKKPGVKYCKFCQSVNGDNEKHLYLECSLFSNVRNTVRDLLEGNCETNVNINLSILLNKLPKTKHKMIHNFNLIIVSEYRNLVWNSRLKAVYHNANFNPNDLDIIYRNIVDFKIEHYKG